MSAKPFFDTNVILYLVSGDTAKADRAEVLVAAGGTVSVQVLNEVADVGTRKLGWSWPRVSELLEAVRSTCSVVPLTVETHDRGRALAVRYRLPVYDAMIAASALLADSQVLYSEDFQDGMKLENRLTVRNPFR